MKIQNGAPQLPKRNLPATPPGPADKPVGVVDSLGSAQLGSALADLGLGVGQTFSHSPTSAAMGVAMSGLHLARGAATLASARKESGSAKNYRLGSAVAEVVLAAGHLAGAAGSAWGLPVLLAGTAAACHTDRRFRELARLGPNGRVEAGPHMGRVQMANNLVDAATALVGFALPGSLAVAGTGHLAQSARHYASRDFSRGYGHAMIAIGQVAGALGTGAWWLAPVLGGVLTTNLEDHRARTWA